MELISKKEGESSSMEKKAQIEIEYSKDANNFFEAHLEVKENFIEKLKAFYNGDKNVDIKILKGITPRQYRIRIGNYRIIFNITKKKTIRLYSIFVIKADSRGNVYKK
jgi:hypothetical protein